MISSTGVDANIAIFIVCAVIYSHFFIVIASKTKVGLYDICVYVLCICIMYIYKDSIVKNTRK